MTDLAHSEAPIPGQLVIDSRTEGDTIVVALHGELDLTSAPAFERELQEAAGSKPTRIVIDLSGLDFMDSTGLRALLQARERANEDGHQLSLRRGPHQVQRVLELTKTEEVFTFED